MEIIIKHLKFPSPVLYVCAACVRQHHQHNLVNIMFPEEKYIRKVIQGCFELGVQVSEELASVFFKCWLFNPNVKNLQKKPLNKTMDRIVDQCIQRLSVPKDPVILCIKMQLLIEHGYKNREFIVNKVNEENDQKIRPLLNDILDNVDHTMSTYYQKIIQYIILFNYMGDPTSPILIQEISDALNNVLNRTKSSEFENQLPSLKLNQLKEISNLVCGIWLYNMDRKDVREETLDMINTLPNAVDLLLQNIDQEIRDSIKKVMMTTAWILQCYKLYTEILAPIFVIRINFATVTIKKLNDFKTVLVFYLQYQKNLEQIKKDLNKLKIELPALLTNFNITLKEIKKLKNTNNFDEDSNDTICPKLNNATVIWSEIRGIMNHLSITCRLISTMKQLTNEIINISEDINNISSIMDTILTDSEEVHKIIETHPLHPMCEWHPPTFSTDDRRDLFADGYCVVMMVETEGTLIKYDKSVGIIEYSDKWFGFANIQAALHFGTKPTYYLNHFLNLIRSKTHLLSFFHLYEQMAETQHNSNELMSEKDKYKDAQVQTAFYPHNTSAIDKNIYNKKEIKKCMNKKVIDTINKTPKVATQSAQTIDVYKSVQVQTKLCDVGSSNTMSEKATNTKQSVSYSSVRFKNKSYPAVEYDDLQFVCSTTIVRPSNNCLTKLKN